MALWEFSLVLRGVVLQDRMRLYCPPISRSGPRGHQLTLQMVRNFIDTRHLTARNFPNSWMTSPMSSFLEKAMRVFSRFGEVVSIDIAQWWQDDDRDGERTIAVEYVHAASGIAAMNTLNGEDTRSNNEKYDDGEPPRKTNRFVCVPTASTVMSESCDCVDRKCRALWQVARRPGASRCGLIRSVMPHPPPPPPPPLPRPPPHRPSPPARGHPAYSAGRGSP